jgi:hypothetical protein
MLLVVVPPLLSALVGFWRAGIFGGGFCILNTRLRLEH